MWNRSPELGDRRREPLQRDEKFSAQATLFPIACHFVASSLQMRSGAIDIPQARKATVALIRVQMGPWFWHVVSELFARADT
jgi:hypothetical protein